MKIDPPRRKLKISKRGFTLIELLVAIAIVGILAAVVLVSMSSYGKKARASKTLAQLSSMFPNILSCLGNGGSSAIINKPANGEQGGSALCSLDASYGQWVLFNGDLSKYRYGASDFASSGRWYLRAYSAEGNDDIGICCNSSQGGCKITGASGTQSTCTATVTP